MQKRKSSRSKNAVVGQASSFEVFPALPEACHVFEILRLSHFQLRSWPCQALELDSSSGPESQVRSLCDCVMLSAKMRIISGALQPGKLVDEVGSEAKECGICVALPLPSLHRGQSPLF